VCPHPVAILIDLVGIRFITNLLQVFGQFFALWIYKQSYRPGRRFELPVG
jgi:hypothetical protein